MSLLGFLKTNLSYLSSLSNNYRCTEQEFLAQIGFVVPKAESSDDNTWVSGLGSRCCNLSFSSPATIY